MTRLRARTEAIRTFIEREIDRSSDDIAKLVATEFGISRQASHRHIKRLEREGIIVGEGKTRSRKYGLVELDGLHRSFPLKNLEEGEVWRVHFHKFMQSLPARATIVANYAVTEMLNNAIEHSGGTRVHVSARRTARSVVFSVRDDGVGIFRKVARALQLPNELQSVLELSKGKFTTAPKDHSGMGIFFSSRACDRMSILSNPIMLMHSESGRDFVFEDNSIEGTGTHIIMTIHLDTQRDLHTMFNEYAGEANQGFTRTIVPVALAEQGDDNLLSRSQAKRVLARIDRFKEVIFDFNGVETVGQAFADEIFRVFQVAHPDVKLMPVNANENINGMIALAWHTLSEREGPELLQRIFRQLPGSVTSA
jgi:anti-sigma regulatory factor (Ser/Thr protein kinase)